MARYFESLTAPGTPEQVLEYLADMRNAVDWDPGVLSVKQTDGSGAGAGARFAVEVAVAGRPLVLDYEAIEYEPGSRVVLQAENRLIRSLDTIETRPHEGGSIVTYDAQLLLRGPLRIFDLLIRRGFRGIGERAGAGLRRVLDGQEPT